MRYAIYYKIQICYKIQTKTAIKQNLKYFLLKNSNLKINNDKTDNKYIDTNTK